MTDKTDTREIVLDILLAVTRDGEYSHIALKNTLDKYQYLEKRERAFLTKVVEGTLEYQIRIDYIINTFSNTKVHKMKPDHPLHPKECGLSDLLFRWSAGFCCLQ